MLWMRFVFLLVISFVDQLDQHHFAGLPADLQLSFSVSETIAALVRVNLVKNAVAILKEPRVFFLRRLV